MVRSSDVRKLILGVAGIAALALVFRVWTEVSNAATVALSFLIVVLLVAATARLWVAVATSLAAMTAFNFFFLPPVGTLTIADPQNWVALFAFLAVSLVASNLSSVARDRTQEAVARRDELGRLFDLSRDVLLITESQEANARLAGFVSRRFDFDYAAICLPRAAEWMVFQAGPQELTLDERDLSAAFARVDQVDASAPDGRSDAGHDVLRVGTHDVHLVPLRLGTKPIGLLAVAGRPVESGTFDALAGLAALAIERAQFLDERKDAELARQSEELKSALLASLGHDLRTPLTAIRVAAGNLQASWPSEQERREQSEIILAEVDQLTRLFQNILEMARIDAGAITEDMRWVAPVRDCRGRAQPRRARAARPRRERVRSKPTGSSGSIRGSRPPRSRICSRTRRSTRRPGRRSTSRAAVSDDGLTIAVRDRGPGIPRPICRTCSNASIAARRPGAADRDGNGAGDCAGRARRSSAGGSRPRIVADGGARFTIVVPAEVK